MRISNNQQILAKLRRWLISNLKVILAFAAGMLVGGRNNNSTQNLKTSVGASGSIHYLDRTPVRNTSHNDKHGHPVTKQQFLEPFAVPRVTGFSVATLKPSQDVPAHDHENMHEFFYILEGEATFQTNSGEVKVGPNTFLHFAPHEVHGLYVDEASSSSEMKMLVAGVTI